MPECNYLFVYGTLRKTPQGRIHVFLEGQTDFIGSATLPGQLYQVAGYPAAISGGGLIRGEVYLLHDSDKIFSVLDEYEECGPGFPEPREYRRCLATVRLGEGPSLTAWTYLYNWPVAGLRRISSGDFFKP